MPWHIETDNSECTGYAVVKDADGHVEGCHNSRGEANAQMAALYASENGRSTMIDYEIRTAEMWPEADYEMRAAADGFDLSGYAAVFGLPSLPMSFANVGGGRRFREVIHPGAFTKTLSELPDVTLRYQHNLNTLPLGRTRSGTLSLAEDDRGLRVRASLPDNEWGRPIRDAVARGDISGMSFRFSKVIDKWDQDADGNHVRHLHEVRLGPEVSITDYPAYPDTSVAVRHLAEVTDVEPDALAEAFRVLRDPEAKLTAEQRDLLMAVVATRTDEPFVGPKVAQYRELLAARG